MSKVIITIAPNGARKTKEDLAHIPLWPEELAEEAKNSAAAGAAMIHLHIRDKEQGHSLDVETYKRTTDAIRKAAGDDIIIQATSESCGIYSPELQMKMVRELRPEAVSLAIRELVPTREHEARAGEFFAWVQENNIWPQFILYSPDEVRYFSELCQRAIVPGNNHFILCVLGKKQRVATADAFARPQDLDPFLPALKEAGAEVTWAICAFGGYENDCVKYAIEKGGHARIGFENNHLLADQSIAPSNAALVSQLVETSGVKPYSAHEVREMFGSKAKAA